MEEFPSNSKNVTGEQKPKVVQEKVVEKVVTTTAVKKRTPLGKRFKNLFGGGDLRNAARYIFGDVLVPAFKNMVVDATSKGMERVVYGDNPRRRYDTVRPRVSYNSSSVVDRFARRPGMLPDQPPRPTYASGRRQDIGEIVIISREEAELVLEQLRDIIDKFEVASVADLYESVGLPSSHVDNKWGWTNLAYSSVRQTRDGFLLDLPPVEPI